MHCATPKYNNMQQRCNGMKYTLSQAATATGKNKATVQRAIKSGKISASKNSSGAYEIDPSELHRVFPPATQLVAQHPNATIRNKMQQGGKGLENSELQRIAELEKELAVSEERKRGIEGQMHHLSETVDDLRKRLDQSEGRVTALLSDQRPKGFWKRLFG
jgi:septal ring factor EnvC (AmiA/AmiB activator)